MDYKDLFYEDSIEKQVKITSDDRLINITNEELDGENMELTESLCTAEQLTFGSCSAAMLKFTVSNVMVPMKGAWLNVDIGLSGMEDYRLGRYKVDSDKPTADRLYRDVIAYDTLYDMINADVVDWYNSLLPTTDTYITLKAFRDSFFKHFDITQKEIALVNDTMTVSRTVDAEALSGGQVLNAICEINGCMGHIGRSGQFEYIYLEQEIEGLYPSEDLFPSEEVYPREPQGTTISKSRYISAEYQDYIVKSIDKVQIRQCEDDIGAIAGDGTNAYIIEDNFLVYGKTAEKLNIIVNNILSKIKGITYRPMSVESIGNPCIEVGDAVRLPTKYAIIESYVLNRTLKGVQSLKDTYTAEGEELRSSQVNSVNKSIVQLKGRINTLTRTVDETKSQIVDVEKKLSTSITQTAEQIRSDASKTYETKEDAKNTKTTLESSMSQTADEIRSEVRSQIQATVTYDNIFEGTQFWGDRLWGDKADATIDNEVLTTHSGQPVTAFFSVDADSTVFVSVERMRENVTVTDATPCFRVILKNNAGNTITEDSFGITFMSGVWTGDYIQYGVKVLPGYTKMAVQLLCTNECSYRRIYVTTSENSLIWKPSPADTPAEIAEMYSQIRQTAEEISTKVAKNEVVSEINQSAEKVKIKANKIEFDGEVIANATLTAATLIGAIINGGAVSFGDNRVVANEDGMWVLGNGGVENPDFRVDKNGFVHLGNSFRMSPAGAWWTDNAGTEHFKSWSSFFGF